MYMYMCDAQPASLSSGDGVRDQSRVVLGGARRNIYELN